MAVYIKFELFFIIIFNCFLQCYCLEKMPCFYKCCPENQILIEQGEKCSEDKMAVVNFSTVPVYDKDLKLTAKYLPDVFGVCGSKFQEIPVISVFDRYLIENGTLYVNNSVNSISIQNNNFCLDIIKSDNNYSVWFKMSEETPSHTKNYWKIAGLLISCVFFLIIVIVHLLFKELRNLRGMIWMFLTGNLFCGFATVSAATIIIIVQEKVENVICAMCGFFHIYFMMSSFCWLNVTAFNIWRDIKYTVRKDLDTYHRTKISIKFGRYFLYSVIVPLIIATLRTINRKPEDCFLTNDENWHYLYYPMVCLIIVNWIFFIMTTWYIVGVMRDTRAVTARSTHDQTKKTYIIYIKLSMLMGLSWLLEVVSTKWPEFSIWYITDVYNILMGIGLFYIILCNRKVLSLIYKRFNINYNFKSSTATSRTKKDSESEITTEDISLSPMPSKGT